ncbi:MAG: hypothetical protein ACLPYS_01435 [Vulcanimicrobiaceae bacterium]
MRAQPIIVDDDGVAKSLRPQQTVTPVAAALTLNIVTDWAVGQEADLATAIRGSQGTVLIAWEHKHIPLIAAELTDAAPAAWPEGAFDAVWLLQWGGGTYTFAQRWQGVLAGDSS